MNEIVLEKEMKKPSRHKGGHKVRTKGDKILYMFVFLIFLVYSLVLVYPVFWGAISSFKSVNDYFTNTFGFPNKWEFSNYAKSFSMITEGGLSFAGMFWNSIWFGGGSAIINLECISFFSYVLQKYKFRGRKFLYGLGLFMMSVPIGASFVSTYRLYYELNMVNSYTILFSATNVYGMNLIIFYSFWGGVSWNYAEASQIDGANFYQIYFKVMRPQVLPMLVSLGLMLFIAKWNDYMAPLLFLPKMPTLATGLFRYSSQVERTGNYPILFAGLVMCAIPIFILFGLFSDKLMTNVSMGGLKG